MPYVKPSRRCTKWGEFATETPGDLNYHITRVCIAYLEHHGKSYDTFNTLVGVLESAKLELYRRAVAPYEDLKAELNGEVYR